MCLLWLLVCGAGSTLAQPAFQLERFEEDHSQTAPGGEGSRLYQRMKHVPLGEDGYISFGGEIRERVDTYDAAAFGIGTRHDTYDLQRILLHADVHWGERMRAFVQFGHHKAFRKTPKSPSDDDATDLQNAFVDVIPDADRRLTLRFGRQDLLLNAAQRFVSVREGPNMRQSFDGASATWAGSDLRLRAFFVKPVKYVPGSFDDAADRGQRFFGVDLSHALGPAETLEVYALELDRDRVRFGTASAHERRRSLALRWAGNKGPMDHDVEAMYQAGTFGSEDIRAWALSMGWGYTFHQHLSPRVGLELDAGSGDRNPNDGRLGTFNPLFPKGAFFDPSSLTSWANLLLVRASVSVVPTSTINLSFSFGERWRQAAGDAVYTQPYVPITATLGNRERRVGEQYEINLTWQASHYLTILGQALHASAGPAIRSAGGRSVNFAMVTAQFRF